MSKTVRKIILRYESSTNKPNDKDFVINSTTKLMRVPKIGERINIAKTQYTVKNVTTNLNIPNPYANKNYMVDEFDGISYYVKLTREVENENKDKKKEDSNNRHTNEHSSDNMASNTNSTNIPSNDTASISSDDMRVITQELEKIKSILSTTLTDLDMKELKDYIKDLLNGKQSVVVPENTKVKEATIEESEDEKGCKILTINKAYRLFTKKDRDISEYTLWDFGDERKDKYAIIKGIKVKTKDIQEGKIYCNNGYLCALDKIDTYNCNKYIGYEYNDIYIILSELENHLKQDGIVGLRDTIFEDAINFSIEDLIKFSVLYPDCIHIKTTIGSNKKYNNTSILVNQFIRNK